MTIQRWLASPRYEGLCCLTFLSVILLGGAAAASAQQTANGVPAYEQAMNRIAQHDLERRGVAMSHIQTRGQAEARKKAVRAKVLRLIGGLPEIRDPLNATVVGTLPEEGFRIERVVYDSLPGYHVTANLYLPDQSDGPSPAVIYSAGHGPAGKAEAFGLASNLARNGIAVLAYDPLGAGERLQAMNPATGKSWAGADEHSQAEIPISLVGDYVARYMVWDAMRGIDYLASRPEIDAKRIGSYGCSGGGTLSAYLTALDERVKAGVVACYLTSYDELLKSIGPQDGEQVIPGFLKEGLDFPDLVELAAPRAYAMVSTTEDMFPFAGARAAHDEAARFYALYGARDRLEWFTGPGRHGAIAPLMPKIVAFYRHWLADDNGPPPEMVTLKRPDAKELQCTATGQVTTGLTGRTIYQINREREQMVLPKRPEVTSRAGLAQLQARLRREIPMVTGVDTTVGRTPVLTMTNTEQRSGYRLQTMIFHNRSGMDLPAMLAVPEKEGRKPALLMTSEESHEGGAAVIGSMFDRAARSGSVVLWMNPMPWPPTTQEEKATLGRWLPWTSRALLVSKTFVGLRTEDMLDALAWLAANREVDRSKIDAYASDASGVALLHAAALGPRLRQITLEHSLATLQSVVDVDVHRGVVESVIPNVLQHYDLDDLMIAINSRQIRVVHPINADGRAMTESEFEAQLGRVFSADIALGLKGRVSLSTEP